MTSTINNMIERINEEIKIAAIEFRDFGNSEFYKKEKHYIDGMCSMLEIATGKPIRWNADGVRIEDK